MLRQYDGMWPDIHPTAFVEESAQVIGDVGIGQDSSIWFQAVLRGDVNSIRIGARTNVQDGAMIHGTFRTCPVIIEEDVTIGHRAVLHGCTVHSCCLIGIGAIVLDRAEIGEYSIIGAGAVVTQGMIVPPKSLALGTPAKIRRELSEEEVRSLKERALRYVAYKNTYLQDVL